MSATRKNEALTAPHAEGSTSGGRRGTNLPNAKGGDDEGRYFSRAVGKAFLMLDLLKTHDEPLTLNEVAKGSDLSKSSTFRLLQTLEQLTYIKQRADGLYEIADKYRANPGVQIVEALLRSDLTTLRALHDEFQETVSLAVLFTNHIEVVRVMESHHLIQMANTVGRILSPHASSLGKAITAFQTEEVRRRLVKSYGLVRFTPATITDEILLRSELDSICKEGIALEKEESTPEGYCFGAPIFQGAEAAVGSISISLPKSRIPAGKPRARMIEALREAASTISAELARSVAPAYRGVSK